MKKIALLLAFSLCNTNIALAGNWNWGGFISSYSFDSEVAAREGVETDAIGLGFIADYSSDRLLMFSSGIEFVEYDDNREFRQVVRIEGGFNNGDVRTESSDALAVIFFADFGPRWSIGDEGRSYLAAKAGVAVPISSERTISGCDNCYDENIDIDGGAYLQGAISKSLGSVAIGLQYMHFVDSNKGIKDSIRLTIGTSF